jgi:hypothetical protein
VGIWVVREEEEEEEGGGVYFKSKLAMNEVDAGRDRATPGHGRRDMGALKRGKGHQKEKQRSTSGAGPWVCVFL